MPIFLEPDGSKLFLDATLIKLQSNELCHHQSSEPVRHSCHSQWVLKQNHIWWNECHGCWHKAIHNLIWDCFFFFIWSSSVIWCCAESIMYASEEAYIQRQKSYAGPCNEGKLGWINHRCLHKKAHARQIECKWE